MLAAACGGDRWGTGETPVPQPLHYGVVVDSVKVSALL
jgi:hypothetical protein